MRPSILLVTLLAACSLVSCASVGNSDERPARFEGVVTNVDTARQVIYLSVGDHESREDKVVKYNSLTIVDRNAPGARVADIQFGEYVLILGRENTQTGDVVADRIGIIENPDRRPVVKPH